MTSGASVHFEEFNPSLGVWVEINAYPSEGGLAIYFRDVTERKQAEEEIKLRARQQEAVAELGRRALAEPDLSVLMEEMVGSLVTRTLNREYCEYSSNSYPTVRDCSYVRAWAGRKGSSETLRSVRTSTPWPATPSLWTSR